MTTADELQARIDAIEESYEFCLAYAAQGVAGEQASKSSAQVREFLGRLESALGVLADLFSSVVAERGDDALTRYQSFIEVLRRDAARRAGRRADGAGPAGRQLADDRQPQRADPPAGPC